MIEIEYIEIGSDFAITIDGLRDVVTTDYINDATVTATLYESDAETTVTGAVDVSIPAIAGTTEGDYAGQIPESVTADLEVGGTYWIEVKVDTGSFKKTWRRKYRAVYARE